MLAIDIGNSRLKWGMFSGDIILCHGAFAYKYDNFENGLNNAGLPYTTDMVMISSVADSGLNDLLIKWLMSNHYKDFSFAKTQSEQCGITNSYKTPSNMGVDRWLAMIAAFNLSNAESDELVCVVDCGTAITLDVVSAQGQHIGGLILPGYQTMMQSLAKSANNIQDFEDSGCSALMSQGLATSTQEAISKGCAQLIVGGVSGIISGQHKKSGRKIHCIVTGGDGGWVSESLTCSNSYNPFLVLQGLSITSTNI